MLFVELHKLCAKPDSSVRKTNAVCPRPRSPLEFYLSPNKFNQPQSEVLE